MSNLLLALGTFSILFVLLYASVALGYRFGIWRKASVDQNSLGIVKVAEGSVFALLGLIIAFSFSGAFERFELRKMKIIDEVNSIETVYHRIDLLQPQDQQHMHTLLRKYVDGRMITFNLLSEFYHFKTELSHTRNEEDFFWAEALQAVKNSNNRDVGLLLLPAINNMFDIANQRVMVTRIHPPFGVFLLLITLAALSGFLIGYGMAKHEKYTLIYVLSFVSITAFTLYIILDLEFPRIGLIRVDSFNYLLEDMRS